jgi:hypothetical protein
VGTSARPRVRHGDGQVVQLRVEVQGLPHPVWRRLNLSSRASLLESHGALQRSLGKLDSHSHSFTIDGVRYDDPGGTGTGLRTTDATSLESLGLYSGAVISYQMETGGAPWVVSITVERIAPRYFGQRLPACVDGQGANPPEDCEGPLRYRELLKSLDTPDDPWVAELREWLPVDFDPSWVDLTAINAELSRLPRHRPAA